MHKTKNHSDAECNKHKEARDKQAACVNFADIGSGRIAKAEEEEECTFGFSFTSVGASSASFVAEPGPKPDKPILAAEPAAGVIPTEKIAQCSGLFAAFGETFMATSSMGQKTIVTADSNSTCWWTAARPNSMLTASSAPDSNIECWTTRSWSSLTR